MALTQAQELKLYAVRYRWAFEELVFSQKMVELNRITSGGARSVFGYLQETYGSGRRALDAVCVEIDDSRGRIPAGATAKQRLRAAVRYYYDAFEQLAQRRKDRETLELWDSVQKMYGYLVQEYGSGALVLDTVKRLVVAQGRPLKSLPLRKV